MELLLVLALVALVAYLVSVPLRRRAGARGAGSDDDLDAELADLEARKRAAYRSIRDAEADHAAGKLSDEDFARLDAELRREAIEILKRIDRLRPEPPAEASAGSSSGPSAG